MINGINYLMSTIHDIIDSNAKIIFDYIDETFYIDSKYISMDFDDIKSGKYTLCTKSYWSRDEIESFLTALSEHFYVYALHFKKDGNYTEGFDACITKM